MMASETLFGFLEAEAGFLADEADGFDLAASGAEFADEGRALDASERKVTVSRSAEPS
jgi:hypothetical protein